MTLCNLDYLWLAMTIPIWVTFLLVRNAPSIAPSWLVSAFFYGKLAVKDERAAVLQRISIPKCWFKYFYMYATVLFTIFTMILLTGVFRTSVNVPWPLSLTLDLLVENRSETQPLAVIVLVQLLTFIQVLRRVIECVSVSVYSTRARIHVWHFAVGFLFYTGVQYSILSMAMVGESRKTSFDWNDILKFRVILGVLLFALGYHIEGDSTRRFARFRSDKAKQESYVLPHGGFFEYVTSPHYFGECFMYVALTLVLLDGVNLTWILCVLFTIVNQTCVAVFAHDWYLRNFKDYPKDRKVIVPFLF